MEVNIKPPYISQERWELWTQVTNKKNKKKNKKKIKCSICLNPINILSKWDKLHMGLSTVDSLNKNTRLECNHVFHVTCWMRNINSRQIDGGGGVCPNCRGNVWGNSRTIPSTPASSPLTQWNSSNAIPAHYNQMSPDINDYNSDID